MNQQVKYRVAVNGPFKVQPIGPLMALDKAESYCADMVRAGFDCVVINTESI